MVSSDYPGDDGNWETMELLKKEAKGKFSQVDAVPIKDIIMKVEGKSYLGFSISYKNLQLLKYDYLLPKISGHVADLAYRVFKYFETFEMKKPYGSETILTCHNKFSTLYSLKSHGLPVPLTYYTSSQKSAEDVLSRMSYPIVIKLVGSEGGKGVLFANNIESARSAVSTLSSMGQELLIEECIENPGEDIRILIIGDEWFAMKRVAKKGEKRANISLGGRGERYTPTKEQLDIAFKAAKLIGSKICGVDMMESEKGDYIIEANINPGLKGITKATNVNIAKKMIDFCYNEVKK